MAVSFSVSVFMVVLTAAATLLLLTSASETAAPSQLHSPPEIRPSASPSPATPQAPPPPAIKEKQFRNILDALVGTGDYGSWANLLSSANPSSLPLTATLFVPSNGAISRLLTAGVQIGSPLIPYHIVPQRLSFADLRSLTTHRLPTLLASKFIVVTNNSPGNFAVDDSRIMQPDIFLNAAFALHGVEKVLNYSVFGGGGGPLSPLPEVAALLRKKKRHPKIIVNVTSSDDEEPASLPETTPQAPPPPPAIKEKQFRNILDALVGTGDYGSWANLLSSANPSSLPLTATLFVPSNGAISRLLTAGVQIGSPLIPYHIVPQRLSFADLRSLTTHRLPTLLASKFIVVANNSPGNFAVDDSRIMQPDIFLNAAFALHGIEKVLNYSVFGGGGGPLSPLPEVAALLRKKKRHPKIIVNGTSSDDEEPASLPETTPQAPPPPPAIKEKQFRNILDALVGTGDYGSWANILSSANPSSLPLTATLFVPSNAGISRNPYHVIQRLSFSDLRRLTTHTRLPSLLAPGNFAVDDSRIMQPDIFLNAAFALHGVEKVLNYSVFGGDGGPLSPVPEMKRKHPKYEANGSSAASPSLSAAVLSSLFGLTALSTFQPTGKVSLRGVKGQSIILARSRPSKKKRVKVSVHRHKYPEPWFRCTGDASFPNTGVVYVAGLIRGAGKTLGLVSPSTRVNCNTQNITQMGEMDALMVTVEQLLLKFPDANWIVLESDNADVIKCLKKAFLCEFVPSESDAYANMQAYLKQMLKGKYVILRHILRELNQATDRLACYSRKVKTLTTYTESDLQKTEFKDVAKHLVEDAKGGKVLVSVKVGTKPVVDDGKWYLLCTEDENAYDDTCYDDEC